MGAAAKKERNNNGRDSYDKDGKGGMKVRRMKKKICPFCIDKVYFIDYKDVLRLRKFVSERGKILPRRISGCCASCQRKLTLAIKRARHIAFLPYTTE